MNRIRRALKFGLFCSAGSAKRLQWRDIIGPPMFMHLWEM